MESKEEETAKVVGFDENESTDITTERDEETMKKLPEVVPDTEDIDDVISFSHVSDEELASREQVLESRLSQMEESVILDRFEGNLLVQFFFSTEKILDR